MEHHGAAGLLDGADHVGLFPQGAETLGDLQVGPGQLGLAPWDAFHQGVAKALGLSLGVVVVLTGVVVLLAWMPSYLHDRFGLSLAMSGLTATPPTATSPKKTNTTSSPKGV